MTVKQIAWLAGLLEGEACFTVKSRATIVIALCLTDKDTLIRARDVMDPDASIRVRKKYARCRQSYEFVVCGNRAIQWMMTIYPLMGQRRQERIREALAAWNRVGKFCRRGHALTGANLYQRMKSNGVRLVHARECRTCEAAMKSARRARLAA